MAVECLVRKYDASGGRKAGDIVSVQPSPAKWGTDEGPPTYVIVTINGMTMKSFEPYKGHHVKTGIFDAKGNEETVRTKYRFDLDTLPNYQLAASSVTISKAQTTANVIDRKAEFLATK